MSQSKYAEQRKAVTKAQAKNLAQAAMVHQRNRMKSTVERIDDLQRLYTVMRQFAKHQVVIHHFLSTDSRPLLYVEPDAEFKRLLLGKAIIIDSRTPHHNKTSKMVNVECHADFNGVDVHWCDIEFKNTSQKVAESGGVSHAKS